MKLRPLADKIVVKMQAADDTTKSGILLTAAAKEKPQMASVIAVGTGKLADGKIIPIDIHIGDKVVINKYSGSEVKLDDEELIIISSSEILAVVE